MWRWRIEVLEGHQICIMRWYFIVLAFESAHFPGAVGVLSAVGMERLEIHVPWEEASFFVSKKNSSGPEEERKFRNARWPHEVVLDTECLNILNKPVERP